MLLIHPTQELEDRILLTFNETEATEREKLQHIKAWLQQQPHLPDTWDDRRLVNFLRGCQYSLEQCKQKLDRYFTVRTLLPEFFANRDISRPELQEVVKHVDVVVLPRLTPDGCRVGVVSCAKFDFPTPDVVDVVKMGLMVADVFLGLEERRFAGEVVILDADVDIARHLPRVSLVAVKKAIASAQEAYPIRVKEVHIVNAKPIVEAMINLVKSVISENIRSRFHLHSGLETLHQMVPRDVLPQEYGGTAGKMEVFKAQWLKKLEEYGPWFKEQEDVKSDESKRTGKLTAHADMFGVEGSFRELDID